MGLRQEKKHKTALIHTLRLSAEKMAHKNPKTHKNVEKTRTCFVGRFVVRNHFDLQMLKR